jgi:hypothetical protein
MKKILVLFLLLSSSIQAQSIIAQSGWTRNKGGFFGKTGFYTLASNTYFDTLGASQNQRRFHQQAVLVYGEYGITKNLTAILNFPVWKAHGYANYETVGGIGDPQLELKWSVFRKIPAIALSLGAEFPMSDTVRLSKSTRDNRPATDPETFNLPTTDGDLNLWSTLAISSGFWSTPGWLTIWAQYNRRGKGYSDQRKLGFEVGYKWTTEFWTNIRLVGLWNGALKKTENQPSIINGQGTEFTTLNIGLSYEFIKHWNLTFDYQTYNDFLAKRKNVYSTPLYMIGISLEL